MVLSSSDNSLIQYSFSWQLRTLQFVAKIPYFSNIYLELTKIEKYDFGQTYLPCFTHPNCLIHLSWELIGGFLAFLNTSVFIPEKPVYKVCQQI